MGPLKLGEDSGKFAPALMRTFLTDCLIAARPLNLQLSYPHGPNLGRIGRSGLSQVILSCPFAELLSRKTSSTKVTRNVAQPQRQCHDRFDWTVGVVLGVRERFERD